MPAPVLIVGQGIAGSALGWACEEAGIEFEIADSGHARASSRVGAGIINPVTGRRLAATWGFDRWSSVAIAMYRAMERVLGRPLVRPMRIHRRFRDEAERAALTRRLESARGTLPHVGAQDEHGFWIDDAWQVDTAALLEGLRTRWLREGRLQERPVLLADELPLRDVTILCAGDGVRASFGFVPWERATGEILSGQACGLDPGVILNRGHWLLPLGGDRIRVGATYVVADGAAVPTAAGRTELMRSADLLLGSEGLAVTGHEAGVRVGVPDRRPCAGRHPETPGLGVLGGLGSKGALWAPALARQWVNHLTEAVPFEPDIDVRRHDRR